jgi:hypothetical protein
MNYKCRSLRRPRTAQELRAWFGDDAECRECPELPPVRRKRRKVPTAWDDIWVKQDRSWKAHRKTQWKEKPQRKAKKSKFRGHLNPRWQYYYGKKIWYPNYQACRWCYRCKVTKVCEATGEVKKGIYDSAYYDRFYFATYL